MTSNRVHTLEVIIWHNTTDTIKLDHMFVVYPHNNLISHITTDVLGDTISRHVESWQMQEHIQFAMYRGREVTFKVINYQYTETCAATYQRTT
jgi:hypothetical protein